MTDVADAVSSINRIAHFYENFEKEENVSFCDYRMIAFFLCLKQDFKLVL